MRTVGWLTLTIVASAFLLFQTADRRLMLALAVLVPIYVLAFYTGSFALPGHRRGGTALAVAWLFVWVWRTYLGGERKPAEAGSHAGAHDLRVRALVGS
jgi:hypothetical protein